MSSEQSYARQIEKLIELAEYLKSFNAEMQNIINHYQEKLLALESAGLPVEVAAKFRSDFLSESKHLIKKNEAIINDEAIPFVLKNAKDLERLVNPKSDIFKRTAAGIGAGVTAVASPFIPLKNSNENVNVFTTVNEVPAIYAESSYQHETLEQAAERTAEQQGFTIKKLGELAEGVQDITENFAEAQKRKEEDF